MHVVAACIPFLLARLIYASMADYNGDPRFNFFDGDNTIYLCLGVLTERFVTAICLAAGFLIPPPMQQASKEAVGLAESGSADQ